MNNDLTGPVHSRSTPREALSVPPSTLDVRDQLAFQRKVFWQLGSQATSAKYDFDVT